MVPELNRRRIIEGAVLAAASGVALASPAETAGAQTASATAKQPVSYEIKPLPFDPKGIKGLSEKILISHHDNNYAGAVRRLNAITYRTTRNSRFRDGARVSDQRVETGRTDRDEFHDPARALFR